MKTSSLYLATHLRAALADAHGELGIALPDGVTIRKLADNVAAKVMNYRSLATHKQRPGPKPEPPPRTMANPPEVNPAEVPKRAVQSVQEPTSKWSKLE